MLGLSGKKGQDYLTADEMHGKIEPLSKEDQKDIFEVVNSAAVQYEGAIPEDRYSEPYMPEPELREEMRKMNFYGFRGERLLGVVGVQNLDEVTLVRHLYVRPERQRGGIGTKLLKFALERAGNEEVLVGTWRDADWAIDFYEENGFELVEDPEELLRKYWDIPERQVEESVVLRRENEK